MTTRFRLPLRPRAIAQAAVLACCAGTLTAQAGQAAQPFAVRMQVLSTCRVSVPPHHDAWPQATGAASAPAAGVLIRCSRKTPFALGRPALPGPALAGTGAGMGTVSASLAEPPATGQATVPIHVNY